MKPIFHCELEYLPSDHLNQIYDGFLKLKRHKIISLKLNPTTGLSTKPIIKMILTILNINKQFIIFYDTLDGLNWIEDSIEQNLNYFQKHFKCNYYFKRSINKEIIKYAPKNCKVYPLGLYYKIEPESFLIYTPITILKHYIKRFMSKYYHRHTLYHNDFEFPPIPNPTTKILLITGLWNPDNISSDHLKAERRKTNEFRIKCITTCRKEFGELFTGGLVKNESSVKIAKDLILPSTLTNRTVFLKNIRKHNICIATTGLHESIGGKFAEYVAQSRAIITEPLQYQIPGNFKSEENYLQFNDEETLIKQIYFLLENKQRLQDLMYRNYIYYNNYLKPDRLVLNTLLRVCKEQ